MDELKKLLEDVQAKFEASQEGRIKAEKAVAAQVKALDEKFAKLEHSEDKEEIKKLMDSIAELQDEISDVRSKYAAPVQLTKAEKEELHDGVLKPIIGKWLKGKSNNTAPEFFKFVGESAAEQFKTLNINNPDEGGRAVAEILSRDVIEYAREYSPILNMVGRKPSMTRNFRELVLVSYPSVKEGIENVAGVTVAETTTQEYKEVVSKEFKVSAKPRITDEAMYGADIDLYGDLIRLLGREISIYLSAQVLYGDGNTKNARGILSSNRVDITNTTGESFKPTLAPDPADARSSDYYPVFSTGVSGALGADDEAIIALVTKVKNTLPTQWLNGASWCMNRNTLDVLENVRDANNKPVFIDSYRNGGELRIMGYPVSIDDTLPDIAADSTPVIFGRLNAAFVINDGDFDKLIIDPYTVDGCTVVKHDKEMFEMVQNSDAILVIACTTNSGA